MTLNDTANKLFNPRSRFFLRYYEWMSQVECRIFYVNGRYYLEPINHGRNRATVFFGKEEIKISLGLSPSSYLIEFQDGYSLYIVENVLDSVTE